MSKPIRTIAPAFAALLAAASYAVAQAAGPANEGAEQNVRQSQQYEQLLCTNASFRAKRIAQECGSIDDPRMRQNCEASFQCGAGNKTAPNWRKAPPSETIR